jgi:porin
VGQFAGQDFYGAQHYAASFIFEPMGYALGNLFTDYESFDPPSTPALEVRVVPVHNLYVKSMVEAEDREPFSHNPTGLVPQFRGVPVSISEIGYTPGKKATGVRAFDNVESRKGYSGLYQFGASYNPSSFTTASGATQSGNYLLYWMVSQALWRVDPRKQGVWTELFHTTGARQTSIATIRCSLRGCASTNRSRCRFITQCRWVTYRTG